jgi:hypothetical protein
LRDDEEAVYGGASREEFKNGGYGLSDEEVAWKMREVIEG